MSVSFFVFIWHPRVEHFFLTVCQYNFVNKTPFILKSIFTGSKCRTRKWFERSKITPISGRQQNERIRVQNQKRQSSERKRIKGNEIFRSRFCIIRSDARNLAKLFGKKLKDRQTNFFTGIRILAF